MASSSKVVFQLDTLRTKALEALDAKIEQVNDGLARHYDDEALALAVTEWRLRQVDRVFSLAQALEEHGQDVSNHTLAAFSVDGMPSRDRWQERDLVRRKEYLINRRAEVEAKSSALVPDDSGNVALTKTQLREFFDL